MGHTLLSAAVLVDAVDPSAASDGAMRIAVFHDLPAGGAKRSTCELVKRLATKHQVVIYTLACAEHDFADLRPHVPQHHVFPFRPTPLCPSPFGRFNAALRLIDLARLNLLSRRIARQIEQDGAEVVLAQPCQFSQSPLLLQHERRLPTVYYCQEPPRVLYERMPTRPGDTAAARWRRGLDRIDPLRQLYGGTLKRTDQRSTRAASRVLVGSQFMRHTVERLYGLSPCIVRHGVDTDRFQPLPTDKQHLVVSAGALSPLKGFDFIIEAIGRIPRRRPTLTIATHAWTPHEAAYLEQLARERGVSLTVLTRVDDDRLVGLYTAAKVTAYAPIREPFGLVPLESMACATPVVAVRDGGVGESVLHERTGLLVERDAAQCADALQQLLSNEDLASGYGRAGREHVRRTWTWDHAAGVLEQQLAACAAT